MNDTYLKRRTELYEKRHLKTLMGVILHTEKGYPELHLSIKKKPFGRWYNKDGKTKSQSSKFACGRQFDEFLIQHMEEGNLDPDDLILLAERCKLN